MEVMDAVRFDLRELPDPVDADVQIPAINIYVNETLLAEVVETVEKPFAEAEGHPSISGGYIGASPSQLDGSPTHHFMGSDGSHRHCGPSDRTLLLVCSGCLESGCWPLMARITVTHDTVSWSDFLQPHRKGSWRYDGVMFTFDRAQYEAGLAEIEG
jgi:hypothetical protein